MSLVTILTHRDPKLEAKHRSAFEDLLEKSNNPREGKQSHDRWWPTTRLDSDRDE